MEKSFLTNSGDPKASLNYERMNQSTNHENVQKLRLVVECICSAGARSLCNNIIPIARIVNSKERSCNE